MWGFVQTAERGDFTNILGFHARQAIDQKHVAGHRSPNSRKMGQE